MLGPGDRFVMEGLVCSFQTSKDQNGNGHLIQMGSMLRKTAPHGTDMPRWLVAPFVSAFCQAYACRMLMDLKTNGRTGFELTFVTAPAQEHHEEAHLISVRRDAVGLILFEESGEGALQSLIGIFDRRQLDIFRWMLEAFTGKPYTVTVEAEEIRWSPPPKKPSYAPLPRDHSSDEPPPTQKAPQTQKSQARGGPAHQKSRK